ncbi:YUC10 [Symbiodinium microadriaticum]|nr:YUC10 [Symbiodinium microadriaticum]
MQQLKGHEEQTGPRRPVGGHYGAVKHREAWPELLAREHAEIGSREQPFVVIIGGAQSGIVLAARLQNLGVPYIVLEKNPSPGHQWRHRYNSLCLHDPVWVCHLPYLPFPAQWPLYAPKDKVADWLDFYTQMLDLNVWANSLCESASWNEKTKDWTVCVRREGKEIVLQPKHVVMATGHHGPPNVPTFRGSENFQGELMHSSSYQGAAAFAGKNVVVVGSNTSAHDICQDLWEHDASVTMLQRGSTTIVSAAALREVLLKDLYSEEALATGMTTEKADLRFASEPYAVAIEGMKETCSKMKDFDRELLQKLEKVGFQMDFGEDDTGNFVKYLRTGNGYYFDVGACELVANGSIKLKVGSIDHICESGLAMEDGSMLSADVIILATGYQSMAKPLAQIFGEDVARKVGPVWGLGSATRGDPGPWEGELRAMWKPTRQENLWLHGGNFMLNRLHSHHLALQLKARQVGLNPTAPGLRLIIYWIV